MKERGRVTGVGHGEMFRATEDLTVCSFQQPLRFIPSDGFLKNHQTVARICCNNTSGPDKHRGRISLLQILTMFIKYVMCLGASSGSWVPGKGSEGLLKVRVKSRLLACHVKLSGSARLCHLPSSLSLNLSLYYKPAVCDINHHCPLLMSASCQALG